jgi:hypothetical protein
MENTPPEQVLNCRNCNYPLPENANFCPNCSQKNTTGRIGLWELLKDSFEAIFNIDSRFFHTLRDIFIPGKLTKEYFLGRHKKYANPFRLFFVMAIVHFAILSVVVMNALRDEITDMTDSQKKTAFRADFLEELDTISARLLDSAFAEQPIAQEFYDTIRAEEERRKGNFTMGTGYIYLDDQWRFKTKTIQFKWEEVFRLTEDEIIEKHNVNQGIMAEAQVRQMLRVNKEPTNFFRFLFSQFIWMVLLMLLFLGLLLKLLYIRRDKYYVEHLVFSFHYHAFAFLITTIPLLLYQLLPKYVSGSEFGIMLGIAFAIVLVYLYIAMKRVYEQGWFKTFVKYWTVNFFYLFIFNVFLALTFIASALFF